jgi:hypothetical protein
LVSILSQNANFNFVAGTKLNLDGADATAAEASLYSAKGLALPDNFTVRASTLNLSDANAMATRGAHFTAGPTDKIAIVVDSTDGTLSLTQANKIINAGTGGGVNFVSGHLS